MRRVPSKLIRVKLLLALGVATVSIATVCLLVTAVFALQSRTYPPHFHMEPVEIGNTWFTLNEHLAKLASVEELSLSSENATRVFKRLSGKKFAFSGKDKELTLEEGLSVMLSNVGYLSLNFMEAFNIVKKEFKAMSFVTYDSFPEALAGQANEKGEIILVLTDMAYATMALNFYLTSLVKFNIRNYLFVGSDVNVCGFLRSYGAECYTHFEDNRGDKASNWGTSEFRRKTHFKTKIILDSLRLKYTVLIVDVDIVFFKNPFDHFHCSDCDIQIQSDVSEGNSGFYLSRPTKPCIDLHSKAWELSKRPNAQSNQKLLDRNMEKMMKQKRIKVRVLKDATFPNGEVYFERGKRMFLGDNPCKDCVMVHNNWIVSGDAKEFRFKENGMWDVDNDGYYSNPDARFLLYNNPEDAENESTFKRDIEALQNALFIGFILNRTVIMPSFNCYKCQYGACKTAHHRCSFHTHFRMTTFNQYFQGQYREHVFLQHPKVPAAIKHSLSPLFTIAVRQFNTSNATLQTNGIKDIIFTPYKISLGVSPSEIVKWFGKMKFSVLHFSSMDFELRGHPQSLSFHGDINKKLAHGFSKTDYRQY